ncbi:MAG: hypothetical protein ACYDCB_08620, partial [Candidatus Dormibacteria bacterium]
MIVPQVLPPVDQLTPSPETAVPEVLVTVTTAELFDPLPATTLIVDGLTATVLAFEGPIWLTVLLLLPDTLPDAA